MKRVLAILATSCVVTSAGTASAAENWTTRLPGVSGGLAVGALPPEGVYFVEDNIFCSTHGYDNSGHSTATRVDAYINVPVVEWVPGVKILGADYAAAISKPFDYVVATGGASTSAAGNNLGSGFGWFDTLVVPGVLSWSLPYDVHVSTQLGVWLPDGSKDPSRMAVQTSNRYWALEPSVGISWIHDGWNANLALVYDANFEKDADNALGATNYQTYRSGDQFTADYSVLKSVGKWTFGVTGYALQQIEKDQVKIDGVRHNLDNSQAARIALGPLVGYDFGPVAVQAYYQQEVKTENYVGGSEFWTRLIIPLSF